MSGGVDSSVSAALLAQQGYDVIGLMMQLWAEPVEAGSDVNRCCTPAQMTDAQHVARILGIPFYVLDLRQAFRDEIVSPFVAAYGQGLTPNPCLWCNRRIRFGHLLNHARGLGAASLATGHYARTVQREGGRVALLRGVDGEKDQSYVLSMVTQEQLQYALFPIGEYTKPRVRKLAQEFGLPTASKAESQDLCFVADGDYRRFLREVMPEAARRGPIVNRDGQVLGEHRGLSYYTIGQRKGIGIAWEEPLYVLAIRPETNELVVGTHDELGGDRLVAHEVNWIAGEPPSGPARAGVKIRYRGEEVPALVTPIGKDEAAVHFDRQLRDITPGQGVVFYDDEVVLGGGIIGKSGADG